MSRNSQAQSSSSEALLGGLGEWAGDKVGSGVNSSADLVKHRPSIAITSMSTLNINVTEAVVENFMEVSKGWKLVADQMQALKKQINDRRQSLLRKQVMNMSEHQWSLQNHLHLYLLLLVVLSESSFHYIAFAMRQD